MILVNKAKCHKCGDVLESVTRHDFKQCSCGAIAVDGGKDYIRRIGNSADIEELSEFGPDKRMHDYLPKKPE